MDKIYEQDRKGRRTELGVQGSEGSEGSDDELGCSWGTEREYQANPGYCSSGDRSSGIAVANREGVDTVGYFVEDGENRKVRS